MKMRRPLYRRSVQFVDDMAVCTAYRKNHCTDHLPPRRRAILRALERKVTPRQNQCLYLYYARGLNQVEIGKQLHLSPSTVSRNLANGEKHVDAVLELLEDVIDE